MLSNFIIRSTAAFGGTPFRLKKCTALGSTGAGAGVGAAVGGVPATAAGVAASGTTGAGNTGEEELVGGGADETGTS